MTPRNPILTAHRRNIREDRQNRNKKMNDEISLFKPTELIPIKEYCAVPRPYDLMGILHEAVQKEDYINHSNNPHMVIPKMKIRKSQFTKVGLHAFFKGVIGRYAP